MILYEIEVNNHPFYFFCLEQSALEDIKLHSYLFELLLQLQDFLLFLWRGRGDVDALHILRNIDVAMVLQLEEIEDRRGILGYLFYQWEIVDG